MYRWDIINHFIEKHNCTSYLEIGYYKGWSFDKINCEYKKAVDPFPCKDINQENMAYGSDLFYQERDTICSIMKITSDDYFQSLSEENKYGVIFIDGLHEAEQVFKDITNSLKHLKEGGVIVLHDCNPPQFEHTTSGIDGCWTGDTYKAVLKARTELNINFQCVDTDWGIGIITPSKDPNPMDCTAGIADWGEFSKNRVQYLNLISVEDFIKQELYEKGFFISL